MTTSARDPVLVGNAETAPLFAHEVLDRTQAIVPSSIVTHQKLL